MRRCHVSPRCCCCCCWSGRAKWGRSPQPSKPCSQPCAAVTASSTGRISRLRSSRSSRTGAERFSARKVLLLTRRRFFATQRRHIVCGAARQCVVRLQIVRRGATGTRALLRGSRDSTRGSSGGTETAPSPFNRVLLRSISDQRHS